MDGGRGWFGGNWVVVVQVVVEEAFEIRQMVVMGLDGLVWGHRCLRVFLGGGAYGWRLGGRGIGRLGRLFKEP